jgi:hypothetical protein
MGGYRKKEAFMKNLLARLALLLGIIALVGVIGFTMSCSNTGGGDPTLPGTITISASDGGTSAVVGATLTAKYTTTGTEIVTYQWKRGGSAITGATSTTFVTTTAGNHTVTVSADGFKSKDSNTINVTSGEEGGPGGEEGDLDPEAAIFKTQLIQQYAGYPEAVRDQLWDQAIDFFNEEYPGLDLKKTDPNTWTNAEWNRIAAVIAAAEED